MIQVAQNKRAYQNQPREMNNNDSESESSGDSELSEGALVARDRIAPKTQADYASALNGLKQFAFRVYPKP